MKYKCLHCGAIVDEEDLRTESELVGEFWGEPAYQDYTVCPECGYDELEEAIQCSNCEEYFTEDEMIGGICEECLHTRDRDFEFWYDKCERHGVTASVEINALLAAQFDACEINEILLSELRKASQAFPGAIGCKAFVEDDKSWAADMIEEGDDD